MKTPHEIQFGRNIDNLLAHADESGIWVICDLRLDASYPEGKSN